MEILGNCDIKTNQCILTTKQFNLVSAHCCSDIIQIKATLLRCPPAPRLSHSQVPLVPPHLSSVNMVKNAAVVDVAAL